MTPEELEEYMSSIKALNGVPYDKRARMVMFECIPHVPCYAPYEGADIRLLQELGQEYPNVDLFREFRKARDWLANNALNAPSKIPKSDFRKFLRNWVSHAKPGQPPDQRRIIGYETEVTFVPVKDDVKGGDGNAGTGSIQTQNTV
jgi:hypothetical protein